MPKPIVAYVLICQRILLEKDDVFSAIRIVDIFWIDPVEDIPLEKQTVSISFVATAKVDAPDDIFSHKMEVRILSPAGKSTELAQGPKEGMPRKFPGAPNGFNMVGQVAIPVKELGTYYVTLLFDGEEVARSPFTLMLRTEMETE